MRKPRAKTYDIKGLSAWDVIRIKNGLEYAIQVWETREDRELGEVMVPGYRKLLNSLSEVFIQAEDYGYAMSKYNKGGS